MSETVQANDGAMLPLSSIANNFIYSGGFISSITVQYAGNLYTQTFLNDGTNIIYISNWVNANYPETEVPMVTESGDVMITEDGQIMITE